MQRPTTRTPAARIATAVLVVALTASIAATWPGPAVPASAQQDGLRLELVDQAFSITPDGLIQLVYRIVGDLAGVADLVPQTTTPPTTTPATTTPATTTPATTTPAAPAAPATTEPNATIVAPPLPLTIDVANYAPIENASDLAGILGPDARVGAFDGNIDGVRLEDARERIDVAADGSATLTLEIPTDGGDPDVPSEPGALKFVDPGLHPLRVQLLVDGEVVATHGTIVERLSARPGISREPVDLTVVATVDRPPAGRPASAATDAQFASLVDLAAAIESPVLGVVPPPVVVDQVGRTDAVATAAALVDDELSALPALDLDVSSAVAAGLGDEFARQLRAGEDLLDDALPTVPSGRDVWVATAPLSARGARELRDVGFRAIVMSEDLYRSTISTTPLATDRFVDVALPDGSVMPVIVVDEISQDLTPETTADILLDRTSTEWSVETLAHILLDRDATGPRVQRSLVLSTPDLTAPAPELLVALEQLVATTPNVRFSVASVLTGVTGTQSVGGELAFPVDAGPDLTVRVDRIEGTRLRLASAASMLPGDDPRPAAWTNTLNGLISTGLSEDAVTATIDTLTRQADALRAAIVPPDSFTFTMTGRSDDITLRLGNLSAEPLDVVIHLESPKLTFPDNDVRVTLRPNDNTDVQVPVRARSNGTSPVDVEVRTPLGEPLGEPVTLTSRVNALTGLGQALTGGLALVLLTWWFTNWRAKRRLSDDDLLDGSISEAGPGRTSLTTD